MIAFTRTKRWPVVALLLASLGLWGCPQSVDFGDFQQAPPPVDDGDNGGGDPGGAVTESSTFDPATLGAAPDGSFTLGTPPVTASFSGGTAQTVSNPDLARSGGTAWLIAEGDTGVVTFGSPASEVGLWFRQELESGVVTAKAQGVSQRKTECGLSDQGNDNAEAFGQEMFLRGGFNDWGNPSPTEPYNFINFGDDVYQAEFELVAGTYEYKLADAGWTLEYANADAATVVGTAIVLTGGAAAGAPNGSLEIAEDGCYNFTAVADSSELPAPSAELTVTKVTLDDDDGGGGGPATGASVVRVYDTDDVEIASVDGTTGFQEVTVTRADGQTLIGRIEVENIVGTAARPAGLMKAECGLSDQGNDNAEAFGQEMFLRGGFNDWGNPSPTEPYNFINFGDDVYQAEFELVAGTYEYKLADAGWTLEYANADAATVVGTAIVLTGGAAAGAPNGSLEIAEDGCYNFTAVADSSELPAPSAELTVTKVTLDDDDGGGGGGIGLVAVDDFTFTATPDDDGQTTTGDPVEASATLTGSQSLATGRASLVIDDLTGEISGSVRLGGVTATSVSLVLDGVSVLSLVQDGSDPDLWRVPDGATLTAEQLAAYLAGGLEVVAGSGDFPAGEIAGQVRPVGLIVLPDNGAIGDRQLKDEIVYFVMTDRFFNGDPTNDEGGATGTISSGGLNPTSSGAYHGGDLVGIEAKLDYIQGLGATSIWISPPVANKATQPGSNGYHGYWGVDFENVDPHHGTNQQYKDFIDSAHARGIKIIQDIVVNHTADVITFDEGQFTYRPLSGPAYTPVIPAGQETAKNPAWMNDTQYYHNRGNTTFQGESEVYGDFAGLDDLATEQQFVVDGMIDIYAGWIEDYGIDGFRVDTVRNVHKSLWQQWAPAMLDVAAAEGIAHFSFFGEIFDRDPAGPSEFITSGRFPSVLDFPLQGTIFAAATSTDNLRNLFEADDYYIDADSDARDLVTFPGNHDAGRAGFFVNQNGAGLSDEQKLGFVKLAYAIPFFARGTPVIYYGDEQGFTGDGGDQGARQDMGPSQVASYNNDDLIGTDATTADDNFDPAHPLYRAFSDFAAVFKAHATLRRGVQVHRYSVDSAGLYGLSRIDPADPVEYLVVFNSATSDAAASIPTDTPEASFFAVWPPGNPVLTSSVDGAVQVSVPPLDFVIYRADRPVPAPAAVAAIALPNLTPGQKITGRVEVLADLVTDGFTAVDFEVSVDGGPFEFAGRDYTPPYRIFWDSREVASPSGAAFRASVVNPAGDTVTAGVDVIVDNRQLTTLTVNYENGNDRSDLVLVTGSGQVLGPYDIAGGVAQIDLAGVDDDLTLVFEDRLVDAFSFDQPVFLSSDDQATLAVDDGSGALTLEVYINNDLDVATSDNYLGAGAPPVLASDAGAAAPFGGTELFVRGSFEGWSDPPAAENAMTYIGNYTYKATLTLGAGDISYKMADAGWTSETNFGSPVSADGLFADGGSGNLSQTIPETGSWDFYLFSVPVGMDVRYTFHHVTPSDLAVDPGPYGVPLFVRGSFNDWGTTNLMAWDEDTSTFTAEITLDAANHQLKIASEDWSTADFGGDGSDNNLVPGTPYDLMTGGDNLLLNLTTAGSFLFSVDAADTGAPVLTVDPAQ